MANTVIQLKKSAVPTAQPDAGSLANGELAINYADGKLFYKDSAGIVQQISGGGNTFSTINAAGTLLIADVPGDILTIDAGQNIEISSSLLLDSLTISANLTSANNYAGYMANAANAYAASLTPDLSPVFIVANGAYTQANAAYSHANNVATGANAYSVSVGASSNAYVNISTGAANAYSITIGASSNDYTNTVGTSANNYAGYMANAANSWANSLASAGNAYSNTVGSAGNTYTISVGAAGNAYVNVVGASANSWANTKLSNTDNVVFGGNLRVSNTLYAYDVVIANSMIANVTGNITNLTVTNNVYIGGSITNVTQLMFNTGTNITPTVPGALTWSQDDSTLHFDTGTPSNTIIHIGQDLVYLVKNQSGSTIYKGNVCMFAGTLGASGRLLIQKAIANNSYPSNYVMGVASTNILNGDDGIVIAQGKVRGINTSMFSAGDILYLSSTNPGSYSNVMPTAPNNKVTMAAVIYSDNNNGSIQVRPTLGSKLNEDEYVEINGIANGDMLFYVSANGRFENKSQANVNAGLLNGYTQSTSNVANTVVLRDQFGNFSAGNITSYTSNTQYINMVGQATDPGQVEGRIWYDNTLDHALNYYTDITGVAIAMGRQQVFRVRNATANTYNVGQAVYASTGSVSKVPDIDLAIASDLTKSAAIGVVFGSNIGPNSFGYVLAMGTYVYGDTRDYGTEGTRLYLSATNAGALQNTMPSAPNHPVQVGVVTYQNASQGTILISSIQRLTGLNLANGSIGFLVDGLQGRVGEDNANLRYDTGNTTIHFGKANVNILHVGGVNVLPSFAASNAWANTVGAASNTYANNTFVKLTAPSQTITGDISISGNLFIGGNTTSVSANNLIVNDPLIYLANNNPDDILDIGFVGSYVNSGSAHVHTGIYRDHTSKQYYLFQGYYGNPGINNEITPYSNNMVNATLVADLLTSNLTLGGANAIIWIKSSYDTSNGGFTTANAAFNKANAANVLAYNTGVGANSYSDSLLITAQQHTNTSTEVANNYTNTSTGAANTWANTVAAAANAYSNSLLVTARAYTNTSTDAAYTWANSVGTAGNTYASSVGTSANAYTVTVGASGNAYTNTSVSAANNFAGSMANAVNAYTTATYSTLTQLGENWTVTNSAYSFANTVNTFAYGVAANAKGAFDKANSVTGGATISNTAPSTPAAGSLWWNTTYGRLLVYYNDGDTSQWVDATPISAAKVTMSDLTPTTPLAGQLWWNNEYGRLFVYYTDEDNTSQWVDTNPATNSILIDNKANAAYVISNAAFDRANTAQIQALLYALAF